MIHPAKEVSLYLAIQSSSMSERQMARTIGVDRGTVRDRKQHGPRLVGTDCWDDDEMPFGQIEFRRTARYWCDGCRTWITLTPCPACLARARR